METWAQTHRVQASAKVDFFAPAAPQRQGRGAVAQEAISPGELLLQIPLEACLTPLRLPDLPDFVDEQQKLMLRLLHEDLVLGDKSPWRPYLDTLPRDFPTLPLWYTPEELRLLRGTSVESLLAGGHIANPQDLEGILSWCQEHPEVFPPSVGLTLGSLRWAASVVASRAFDSSHAGVVLAPFADALNHSGARPHTRMRDGGELLVFSAERTVEQGEELLNCYGEHGNSQWLLNGGFVDSDCAFEELLVSRAEVVSAALTHLGAQRDQGSCEEEEESESEEDEGGGIEGRASQRLAWLQHQRLAADDSFAITSDDLLPDGMVTLLIVLCMGNADFEEFQGDGRLIDLATEDVAEPLLRELYGAVLRLADLVERRYETSLEDDVSLLQELFGVEAAEPPRVAAPPGSMPPPRPKRPRLDPEKPSAGDQAAAVQRCFGPSVRPMNARNILQLRVRQKRLLRELRNRTQACFEAESEEEQEAQGGAEGDVEEDSGSGQAHPRAAAAA